MVGRFLSAFNRGDLRRLDAIVAAGDGGGDARTPSCQWFSGRVLGDPRAVLGLRGGSG